MSSVQPAAATPPVARVDGHDDPLGAVGGDHPGREAGVAQRRGAEHRARGPRRQDRRDRVGVAQATANLDGDLDRVHDPRDVAHVDRRALARPIEVDDVQRAGAAVDPPPCRVKRVGVIDGLAGEVAAGQAHGAAPADIDRRPEDHARSAAGRAPPCAARRVNAPSSASPCAEDFSG